VKRPTFSSSNHPEQKTKKGTHTRDRDYTDGAKGEPLDDTREPGNDKRDGTKGSDPS
jgi:hypothetical protein